MQTGSKTGEEDVLRKIMQEVTGKLTDELRVVLAATLEQQISTALTQSLLESEFYRRISDDMRNGLKKIYKEISNASSEPGVPGAAVDVAGAVSDKARADKLFHEASSQLSAVLTQTEQATESIMEILERHMETQGEAATILDRMTAEGASEAEVQRLVAINGQLGEDLNGMMLALSFQDLTGQRIKRAVTALKEIESTVVEMYLSTGLLIQAYEETPERGLDVIEEEARQKVSALRGVAEESELKGPDAGSSQSQIDDLLAQLGM